MPLRSILVLVCLTIGLARPEPLWAASKLDDDTREAARKLGYSGVTAYEAGDYVGASEKLEKAYRVAPVPSLGLWSARALVKLGKLLEAEQRYQEVASLGASSGDPAVQKRARADAATELSALQPKIPSVLLQIEGASAAEVTLSLDGQPLAAGALGPHRVNPGAHRLEGSRAGKTAFVELTLAEGEQKTALLELGTPTAAPAPVGAAPAQAADRRGLGTQRTLALVAAGVGVVGLGVGTVFGLKSKSSHDEAAQYCSGPVCTEQRGVDAGQDAYAAGNVSTVAMVLGVAAVAGGAALWLTAPRDQEPATALGLGFGTLQLRGAF